ncbi:MAG: phosphohydrolase, partial [Halanaerobium sp.]
MKFMKKLRLKLRNWRREYLDFSTNTYKIIWAVIFFILVALILSLDLIPNQVDLRAGQVSQSDITAPRTITFIDESRTSELRQRAADTAPRVYEEDSTVEEEVLEKVNNLFEAVSSEREFFYNNRNSLELEEDINQSQEGDQAASESSPESEAEEDGLTAAEIGGFSQEEINEIVNLVNREINFNLSGENIAALITLTREELVDSNERALNLLQNKLGNRILPADLSAAQEDLRQSAMEMDISRSKRLALAEITETVIA